MYDWTTAANGDASDVAVTRRERSSRACRAGPANDPGSYLYDHISQSVALTLKSHVSSPSFRAPTFGGTSPLRRPKLEGSASGYTCTATRRLSFESHLLPTRSAD
uniref:Uncharacterized protein n=1 Tax=Peronospora matthiolae TaxID=2874970 RepID=A0AAV1VC65_9STRA